MEIYLYFYATINLIGVTVKANNIFPLENKIITYRKNFSNDYENSSNKFLLNNSKYLFLSHDNEVLPFINSDKTQNYNFEKYTEKLSKRSANEVSSTTNSILGPENVIEKEIIIYNNNENNFKIDLESMENEELKVIPPIIKTSPENGFNNSDPENQTNVTTAKNNTEKMRKNKFKAKQWTDIILHSIIFILGIIGNTLVIITLRTKKNRNVTNIFLFNLVS